MKGRREKREMYDPYAEGALVVNTHPELSHDEHERILHKLLSAPFEVPLYGYTGKSLVVMARWICLR